MADKSRSAPVDTSDGLNAALGIYLVAYSCVAACFALALYALLQPSTSSNPGLDAYTPPPGTVISYVPPMRSKSQPPPDTDGRAAAAVEPGPIAIPPEQPSKEAKAEAKQEEPNKDGHKTEGNAQTGSRRAASHHRERRNLGWDAPSFNNYRPWF
jgi:hypothetical protein